MKTYLVGGAVRDKLLGYPYHENDWVVVGATAQQLRDQGYQQVGKDFPVFLHPESKEEYALARTERKTAPGYTGFDCHSSPDVTLEQDLLRRDLTINAIAEDTDGNIIDPYNGQRDITNKILRHVSPAFTEDPLRILRVARFYARYAHLGFTIANETIELMQSISAGDELLALPGERIWKEMERALAEPNPENFFAALGQANALQTLLPEFIDVDFKILAKPDTTSTPLTAFASLFKTLDEDATIKLCQRIRAPRDYRDLALLISNYSSACDHAISEPETTLALLEKLDPFRRPERFDNFLACCELLGSNQRTIAQLRRAASACKSIDFAKLAAEGLSGKAVAQAIKQKRVQIIAEILE